MLGRVQNPFLGAVALAAFLVLAGCDDSIAGPPAVGEGDLEPGYALLDAGTEVTFRAEAEGFEPGGPVTLVLENGTDGQIGFNLCFHAIEHRSNGEWEMLESSRICTTVLHILDSGETTTFDANLPSDLPAGEYRFRVAVSLLDQGEFRDQVSNSFELEG